MSEPPGSDRSDREGGIVAIWFALLIVILIGIAALAVDLGYWYLVGGRLQSAVDAAALGGVTAQSADPDNAEQVVVGVLSANGFGPESTSIQVEAMPSRLRVTAATQAPSFFAAALGLLSIDLERSATAEYAEQIRMGSPFPVLGFDPEGATASGGYWLAAGGPGTRKLFGDRYGSLACTTAEVCSDGTNDEYVPGGYEFAVDVGETGTGSLTIELFDPVAVNIGTQCQRDVLPTAEEISALVALDPVFYADAAERYAEGRTRFCTGDNDVGGFDMSTEVNVYWPDGTEVVGVGFGDAQCGPRSFSSYLAEESVMPLLDPSGGDLVETSVDPADGRHSFAESFRRWVTICEIPTAQLVPGVYTVRVRTTAPPGGIGAGHNYYSLKATVPGSDAVSVYALGRLPVYVNAENESVEFTLARIPQTGFERTVSVSFFDIGDAAVPGSLQIEPPAESNLAGLSGCRFTLGGSELGTTGGCGLVGLSSAGGFNGRTVTAAVPVPASYRCDVHLGSGCWFSVRISFSGGVYDTTTWSAGSEGRRARLVE